MEKRKSKKERGEGEIERERGGDREKRRREIEGRDQWKVQKYVYQFWYVDAYVCPCVCSRLCCVCYVFLYILPTYTTECVYESISKPPLQSICQINHFGGYNNKACIDMLASDVFFLCTSEWDNILPEMEGLFLQFQVVQSFDVPANAVRIQNNFRGNTGYTISARGYWLMRCIG